MGFNFFSYRMFFGALGVSVICFYTNRLISSFTRHVDKNFVIIPKDNVIIYYPNTCSEKKVTICNGNLKNVFCCDPSEITIDADDIPCITSKNMKNFECNTYSYPDNFVWKTRLIDNASWKYGDDDYRIVVDDNGIKTLFSRVSPGRYYNFTNGNRIIYRIFYG